MVIMEPVQNAGGCVHTAAGLLPGRARDLRPLRDPALRRRGDHRLRPHRRLVRHPSTYDIRPDLITSAKGLSSAYASIGAVIATDQCLRAVPRTAPSMYAHGITFGGHPVQCAIALKNIEIMKRERVLENVRSRRGVLPRRARAAARAGHRRRRARDRLLLRARARQGQEDARRLHDGGVRAAAARLPLAAAVRARADLPRRRPRRPGDPDLAAAGRGHGRDRRDRGDARDVLAEAQDRMHVGSADARPVQPGTRLVGEA